MLLKRISVRSVAAGLVASLAISGCLPAASSPSSVSMSDSGPCADFQLDVEALWSNSIKAEVEANMKRVGGEWGQSVAHSVITKLDTFSRNWVMMKQSSCKDCLERKTLPIKAYNRISSCLDTVLVRQSTLLSVAKSPSRQAISEMEGTLERIGTELQSCRERALDLSEMDTADYAAAERRGKRVVATAEQRVVQLLAQAKTLRDLGEHEGSGRLAKEAYELAEKSSLRRLRVEALIERAHSADGLALFDQELDLATQALREAQEVPNYPEGLSDATIRVGWAEARLGNYKAALRFARSAQESAPRESEQEGKALNLLGASYTELGEYKEAIETLKTALAIEIAALGEVDFKVTATYINLGTAYELSGEIKEALDFYDKAQTINRKMVGTDHPMLAIVDSFKAGVLLRQGRPREAQVLGEKAVVVYLRTLGAEHPRTAVAYATLSGVALALGNNKEAARLSSKTLAIYRKVFGNEHPEIARALNQEARVLAANRDYNGARAAGTEALRIQQAAFGKNHVNVAATYDNSSVIFYMQGDYEESRKAARAALVIYAETYGDDHLLLAGPYDNLSNAAYRAGDYEDSIESAEKALEIFIARLGQQHPSVGRSYASLANVYYAQGENEEALKFYQRALKLLRTSLGEESRDVAEVYGHLAAALIALGRPSEAFDAEAKALRIRERVLGKHHPESQRSRSAIDDLCKAGHSPACG